MVGQRASILQVSARTGPGRGSVSGYDVIYNEDWALQILTRLRLRPTRYIRRKNLTQSQQVRVFKTSSEDASTDYNGGTSTHARDILLQRDTR